MFVDELTIKCVAGNGGDGVVRWRREKFIDKGGPAGGDGGRGGSVYVRAVRNLSLLGKYTGTKEFRAGDGMPGAKSSKHGKDGEDVYIDVPVGSVMREHARDRVYTLETEGQVERILKGGRGGLGNEYFKSATNRTPQESTAGKTGERGIFTIELSLSIDGGFIGMPNAGKTTLLNALTNAEGRVGAYPFTTLEPDLGDFYGYVLADIPGLIEGAHEGKGLGHKFLKHVTRTKMLIHCVSLENEDPLGAYKTIHEELKKYDPTLLEKKEWIVLTKTDTVSATKLEKTLTAFSKKLSAQIFTLSAQENTGVKEFADMLVQHLRREG